MQLGKLGLWAIILLASSSAFGQTQPNLENGYKAYCSYDGSNTAREVEGHAKTMAGRMVENASPVVLVRLSPVALRPGSGQGFTAPSLPKNRERFARFRAAVGDRVIAVKLHMWF